MANRIGQFFEHMPDGQHAQEEMALHLRQFWAPAMRYSLLTHLDSGQPPMLSPWVQAALHQYRDCLDSQPP